MSRQIISPNISSWTHTSVYQPTNYYCGIAKEVKEDISAGIKLEKIDGKFVKIPCDGE